MDASIEELRDDNERLRRENAELRALVKRLEVRLTELEARLGENSSNSSKPPSSDGYGKPTRQQRRTGERKAGKQKGAPGSHLAQVAEPDEVVTHAPARCHECSGDLAGADVCDLERRQVTDIPPIEVFVTEHQAQSRRCGCGAVTTAAFPDGVDAPARYGPRLRSLATYFVVFQHIPYDRTRQLFADVLGIDVSPATMLEAIGTAASGLEDFTAEVRQQLRDADVVHFDETGARVDGSLHWVHSASTELLTDYFVHKRRGSLAMDTGEILSGFHGVAVHDGWKPYRNYDVTHSLCNAHHLRELKAAGVVWDQGWANDLIGLLAVTKQRVEDAIGAGATRLDSAVLHGLRCRFGALIAQGRKVNPRLPGRKQTKTHNLIERLDVHRDDVLRFATDFRVPFDNNQAERDIRMIKLQQKISGCWRTFEGARRYLIVRSYISTARKQSQNALDVLCRLFEGNPWLPTAQVT